VRAIRPVLGLPGGAYNPTLVFSLTEMTAPESKSPCASPDVPASYEEALGELERLVGAMESGQMPLDRLLESYQRGAELLSFCRARLQAVEEQVKVLEDGQLKPWMPNA
jgi:exodeoxyribonuclease VII small subunit